jgi:hypothetical protein
MGRRMTRLADIPIRLAPSAPRESGASMASAEGTEAAGGLGSGVYAIVAELTTLLDSLVRRGQSGVIDLRSLPMSGHDRTELRRLLGEGEVKASFDAEGISRFGETGVAGVWWVEHRDRQGELIAELIEVAPFPQILSSGADDIAAASHVLQARLAEVAAHSSGGPPHDQRQ